VIFDGNLDEAIAISKRNDILVKRVEADEIQFDYGEKLANSKSSESEDDIDF
jgi:hypothetical protein